MANIRVPIDPMNPGQVFACYGLFELMGIKEPGLLARFEASEITPRAGCFVLENASIDLTTVLSSLRNATAEAILVDQRTGGKEESVRPVKAVVADREFVLDWWLDEFQDKTVALKCWAGQVKSSVLVTELLSLIDPATPSNSLFTTSTMSKAKFGVDPRSAWNALDFGFSPNEHNRDTATYPAVEVLACFGLQGFRPVLSNRQVRYNLWMEGLPLRVARLAAFQSWPGLQCGRYLFSIEKRGQSYKYFSFASYKNKEEKGEL